MFTDMGAKVITVGLPKNGHDIFSVWFADIAGNYRVAIVPNKPWKEWLNIEKEEIEINIRDLVNAAN